MEEMADLIASGVWEVTEPVGEDMPLDCGHVIKKGGVFHWNQSECRSVCRLCLPYDAIFDEAVE